VSDADKSDLSSEDSASKFAELSGTFGNAGGRSNDSKEFRSTRSLPRVSEDYVEASSGQSITS